MAITGPLLAAAAIGETGFSIFSQVKSAQAREEALQTRLEQERAAANQREILRGQKLNSVLASQNAIEASRGIALSSPTFFALQSRSFDDFAQDQNADNLSLSFQQEAISQEKRNVRAEEIFGIGNSLFNAALTAHNLRVPGVDSPGIDDSIFAKRTFEGPEGLNNDLPEI